MEPRKFYVDSDEIIDEILNSNGKLWFNTTCDPLKSGDIIIGKEKMVEVNSCYKSFVVETEFFQPRFNYFNLVNEEDIDDDSYERGFDFGGDCFNRVDYCIILPPNEKKNKLIK